VLKIGQARRESLITCLRIRASSFAQCGEDVGMRGTSGRQRITGSQPVALDWHVDVSGWDERVLSGL